MRSNVSKHNLMRVAKDYIEYALLLSTLTSPWILGKQLVSASNTHDTDVVK